MFIVHICRPDASQHHLVTVIIIIVKNKTLNESPEIYTELGLDQLVR